ncbi:putative gustatory receptor 28a isoform X1 [Zootermopsis nevadensis]|uniref:putative gustatory receptor 28a isoform X1 n=1 Tax=Zootermopsis nevadensis TaxID=136037 RepID=UPI000B8E8944|nr:putative gustatory receptor 28a isoform X1 [Zootermopsis nevadensis]
MLITLVARQLLFVRDLYTIDNVESVLQTASAIEEITSNVAVCVFFLLNLINRRKVYQIFFKLATLDKILGGMCATYKQSLLSVIGQMCFHFIFLGSLGIISVSNGGFNVYGDLFRFISIGSNFLVVLVVDLEITNLVFTLKQRFCIVNSRFSECIGKTNFEIPNPKRWDNTSILYMDNSVPKFIHVKSSLLKLKNLTDLHDFLCDVSALVNSTYSVHMLFDVMLKFVAIIFNVYFRLLRVLNYDRGRYEDNVYEGIMAAVLSWNVLQLTALVWACQSASEEANRTAAIVHKLISNTSDIEVKEELKIFSLKLLHRKVQFTACGFFPLDFTLLHSLEVFSLQLLHRKVHFTACGIFPLDFTLLYSIFGAVTTYLVILIQFQLSIEHDNKVSDATGPSLRVSMTPDPI